MWCRNRYVVISPTCSHRMPTPLPSTPDLCHRAHFVPDSTLATPGFGCSVPQLGNDSSTESSLVQKYINGSTQTGKKKMFRKFGFIYFSVLKV